jgi:hypothetical protein
MEQIHNISNISPIIGKRRVQAVDESATVTSQKGIVGTFFLIESTIARTTLEGLINPPQTAEEDQYLVDAAADRQQIKDAYINMLARLEQIQNAGAIPFTQAGFNQVVQAVKDEALYIERIMKVIARLIT